MHIAVVSTPGASGAARATVTSALSAIPGAVVHVLDLDATNRVDGPERTVLASDLGIGPRQLHQWLASMDPRVVRSRLRLALATEILRSAEDEVVVTTDAGVLFLREPVRLAQRAREVGIALPVRSTPTTAHGGTAPGPRPDRAWATSVLAMHGDATTHLDAWRAALENGPPDETWLSDLEGRLPRAVLDDGAAALGADTLLATDHVAREDGGLTLNGARVDLLDLSRADPSKPWLLDARPGASPARLSAHPALAAFVAEHLWGPADGAPVTSEPPADLSVTSLGTPVDPVLRSIYRSAGADAPDPFDPSERDALVRWLTEPVPGGGPSRWLMGLRDSRPDLVAAFPAVPGRDVPALLTWAATHGRAEGHPPELLPPVQEPAPHRQSLRASVGDVARRARRLADPRPAPGLTVVGFLRGEVGIGESARQIVNAAHAAGVDCSTVTVEPTTGTRSRAPFAPHGASGAVREVTALCVNADLAATVASDLGHQLDRSHRVGYWYWEVEDFPPSQHGGFAHVDEVWVATDFVRQAIEPHSPVPVRVLTPPLPQRGADPLASKEDLGLPDRPFFLFSFDFLSTAERKNPWGLVEAFRRAFAPDEGPVLVVKSINADRRFGDAEHLRVAALGRPDVVLLEDYLDAASRDALVAHCDAYVSLHRSEGLGLTMAEAMAWGKPVIATGYSGNLQFMTQDNSFLVPWAPAVIPGDAAPYPAGGRWAEPDLDEAARLMRLVLDDPDLAAERGARAARDIAELHSPAVAGAAIAERLAELRRPRHR